MGEAMDTRMPSRNEENTVAKQQIAGEFCITTNEQLTDDDYADAWWRFYWSLTIHTN